MNMAAKSSRPGRLETEIEKYRGDGNWSRVLDLSRQVSAKTSHLGNYHNIFFMVCSLYVSISAASAVCYLQSAQTELRDTCPIISAINFPRFYIIFQVGCRLTLHYF